MKKICILSMVMIFSLLVSVNTAFSGHGCHGHGGHGYYWEAAAIGLGVGILGSVIANSCQPQRVTVVEHHTYYEPAPSPRYCEPRRVWVPPVTERVWNPGHYEYGRWVPGQYIIIEREPGYWVEERDYYR
ncbi:MAG: hypothetical protein MUE70_06190 [Desulfobacterales bacterium]|nr:hypothetical protein [Desulfobacterales bacterium]